MKQDRFRNRYMIKLISSLLIAGLNIIIQIILPVALSVEEYGFYSYNLNVFTSVVTISTLSAPNALVAKFSRRNDEIGLVNYYFRFLFGLALVLNLLVIVGYSLSFGSILFKNQTIVIVLLGLESSLLLRINTDCIGIYDAMAISRFPSILQVLLKALLSAFVVVLFCISTLNLYWFYILQIMVTAVISFILIRAFYKEQRLRYPLKKEKGFKAYSKEYFIYCKPLILSTLFSEGVIILMNWIMYRWGGAGESAVFGIAWQFNTLITYIFSPYAELSKREYALNLDNEAMLRSRYEISMILITWMTSFFAFFIGVFSPWFIPLIFAQKYTNYYWVILIIMVYTVFQAIGQVGGAFLLASENTRDSARLAILSQIIRIIAVIIFQVPNALFPDGLGADGMAITYLLSNIITAVLQDIIIIVKLGISKKSIVKRVIPIISCALFCIIIKTLLDLVIIRESALIVWGKLLMAGITYTVVLLVLLYRRTSLFGINSDDIKQVVNKVLKRG